MPTNYIVWQTGLISHFGPYKREERRKRKEGHKKKREIEWELYKKRGYE